MLNRNNKVTVTPDTSSAPSCRFCGKVSVASAIDQSGPECTLCDDVVCVCSQVDPRRSGARWKLVKSPLDQSGQNARLPPPLRFVHFCPSHFRTWIPMCMKTMPTRVILSHIVYGAKPCYEDKKALAEDEEDQVQSNKSKKKRKRPTKK